MALVCAIDCSTETNMLVFVQEIDMTRDTRLTAKEKKKNRHTKKNIESNEYRLHTGSWYQQRLILHIVFISIRE